MAIRYDWLGLSDIASSLASLAPRRLQAPVAQASPGTSLPPSGFDNALSILCLLLLGKGSISKHLSLLSRAPPRPEEAPLLSYSRRARRIFSSCRGW